jgi:hypothetical protein
MSIILFYTYQMQIIYDSKQTMVPKGEKKNRESKDTSEFERKRARSKCVWITLQIIIIINYVLELIMENLECI